MPEEPKGYVRIGSRTRLATAHATPATGRAFRDAWRFPAQTGPITIDLALARDIVRGRVRAERATRWGDADAAFNIAVEAGAPTAAAAAHRQALRDAPLHASIDAASTPADLAAITLDTILAD